MKKIKLFLAAVAAMVTMGVNAQTSPTAGVEVAPGDYYVYNIGSGMYMSKGSSYGTHATVDGAGCVITISGTTDAYALHFAGIDAAKYLGNDGWTDNGTSEYTWSFESATVDGYSNVYKIKDNDKGTYLYWANLSAVDWANEVMVGEMPATLPNGYFLLVPKATREDLSSASSSYPVDVTYLVKDPDIESSIDALKWSGDFARQKSVHAGYSGNYLEKWVDAANALGNFSAYQTLTGLPAGKYRLTIAATAERQNSDIAVTGTYIYAGSNQTEVSATNNYTVEFTTDGSDVQIGMKTVSTTANWVNFDKVRLAYLGADKSISALASADYTAQGSAPTGGHTYVLYNETGKFLYSNGVTPVISNANATFFTLETTGEEFYIRSDAGLLYKQSNSNWNTWTNGGYGDVAKWSATLDNGKYKLQNHNKANASYYFAPNSNGENVQCYSDKTALTGWYFIDVTNKNVAVSLLYAVLQAEAEMAGLADSDAKTVLAAALNNVVTTYVQAANFTSDTYNAGEAAIQTAFDSYYAARFAAVDGTEGGEDITSWITNPTPTSNADGWSVSQTPAFNSGNNNAEFWNKGAASLSQTINLPAGYYRLTAIALTRTGMSAPLAATGANDDKLASMNITTVASATVNNLAQANTWFNNGYGVNELDFYVPTTQDVTISLTADNTTGDHWIVWRSFQLTAVGNAEVNLLNLEKYLDNAKLTPANALLNDASYVHVTGTERTDLQSAVTALTDYADGESTVAANVAARKTMKYALVALYNTMSPASVKQAYDEYYYENETAARLGADASSVSAPTTAAEAETAAHAINVINYNKFVEEEYADVSAAVLGEWTDDNVDSRKNQHWSGDTSKEYFEMNTGYNTATVWEMSRQQTVNLAAGTYVLKVAARVSAGADAELSVTVGSSDPIVTYAGHHGDSGKGITTDGVASYDDEDTFAGNTGKGFEWRYIPFTLDADGDVTLKFYAKNTSSNLNQYVSFCDLGIWTDPKIAARTELLTAISSATAARKGANEGTGIFQIPTSEGTTLANAITAAQEVYNNEEATLQDITSATIGMNTAVTGYENATLNAPDASKRYKLTLANKGALTFQTASTEGGYGMPFQAAADYKAQTFFLTQVSGNTYNLSFVDFDGNTRYVCTRADYGEGGTGTAGIRTTDDSSKALGILIQPTATANVFNMLNTARDNEKLGAQNNGDLYTVADNSDWSIAEASQAEFTVSCKAGKYGTVIFPFAVDISEFSGVKFYSCESVHPVSNRVQIEEVSTLEANVPYLIQNEGADNFSKAVSGWGVATADSYTDEAGLLTGVFTEANIPAGANNYVLQTQGDEQAFYNVNTDFTATAYKCYLTYNSGAGAGVKALGFEFRTPTSVRGLEMAEGQNDAIFNLAGQRVNKAQKGIYIVNGKKVAVK